MTQEIENPSVETVPRHKVVKILGALSTALILILGAVVFSGIRERRALAEGLVQTAKEGSAASVSIVYPQNGGNADELVLPANMQPYVDAPIYARTHGYLKLWYFDIGAHVQQGQLLAEIETPEVDQQLLQARADLKSVQANLDLAQTTAVRWQNLLAKHAVSKQETDQAVSDFASKQAAVDASMANVHRLEQLQSFEKVYAPFDGVITARETDVGAR
jgi:RND family efflux transporter MFP subunit